MSTIVNVLYVGNVVEEAFANMDKYDQNVGNVEDLLFANMEDKNRCARSVEDRQFVFMVDRNRIAKTVEDHQFIYTDVSEACVADRIFDALIKFKRLEKISQQFKNFVHVCVQCGGGSICEHGRQRRFCKMVQVCSKSFSTTKVVCIGKT